MTTITAIETAFGLVVRASAQGVVLVAVVLVIQRLLGNRISRMWRYNLWFLVLLRLTFPNLPDSSFSFFNWAPANPVGQFAEMPAPNAVAGTIRNGTLQNSATSLHHISGAEVQTEPRFEWEADERTGGIEGETASYPPQLAEPNCPRNGWKLRSNRNSPRRPAARSSLKRLTTGRGPPFQTII